MAVSSKKAKVEGSPDAGLLVEGGSESDTDYNGGGEDCADSYSESGSSVDSNMVSREISCTRLSSHLNVGDRGRI